jgi:opacity protein-like surface antigen
MRKRLSTAIAALALTIAPSMAFADGYFVPFIGANFGGDVGRPLSETVDDRNRMTFGFGVGGMAGGIFGAEFDFGYTRNFYANDGTVVTKSNLITAMPALIVGIPIGGQSGPGIRPYVLAGAGLLRRDLDFDTLDNLSSNDFGYTLGGGIMGYFSDRVGLRGDVRYFRNFQVDEFDLDGIDFEEGTFNFGRASIGLLIRF